MDMKRFFLYAIVIAALALAGCGGNGGNGTAGGGNGNGNGTPPPVVTPAGPTVQDLFEAAQMAEDMAEVAQTDADDAVKAATEASGKLNVRDVGGNSMMAQMNAEAVLYNKEKADNAVTTAETALADLMQADTDADEHDNAQLNSAIADAIKIAEAAVEATKEDAESDALKTAVETVTGDDPDAEGYPRTAVKVGEAVAMQIGMALMPTSPTDGAGVRVTDLADITTAPDDTSDPDPKTRVLMNDHQGNTWAEIVGNVMTMRITSADNLTRVVEAASFVGMPAASASSGTAPTMTDDGVANGTEYDDASYKGIPGTSFCAGTDCNVDADGNLVGSWYFTPTNKDEFYVKTADGMMYQVETLYARFGHWLSQAGDPLVTTVNLYAAVGNTNTNTSGLDVTTVNTTGDTLTDSSATYTGTAAGMSLHKEIDSDGMAVPGTLQSGAFTADVTLNATFGTAPTIGGTIDNFRSENAGAVDSDWSVNLLTTGFTGAAVASTAGRTTASGQDGEWQANSYGVSGARPTGIYGGFNAHFSDGHAAGAYATRKQ